MVIFKEKLAKEGAGAEGNDKNEKIVGKKRGASAVVAKPKGRAAKPAVKKGR